MDNRSKNSENFENFKDHIELRCCITGYKSLFPLFSTTTGLIYDESTIMELMHQRSNENESLICPITKKTFDKNELIRIKNNQVYNNFRELESSNTKNLIEKIGDSLNSIALKNIKLSNELYEKKLEYSHSIYKKEASMKVINSLINEIDTLKNKFFSFQELYEKISIDNSKNSHNNSKVSYDKESVKNLTLDNNLISYFITLAKDLSNERKSNKKKKEELNNLKLVNKLNIYSSKTTCSDGKFSDKNIDKFSFYSNHKLNIESKGVNVLCTNKIGEIFYKSNDIILIHSSNEKDKVKEFNPIKDISIFDETIFATSYSNDDNVNIFKCNTEMNSIDILCSIKEENDLVLNNGRYVTCHPQAPFILSGSNDEKDKGFFSLYDLNNVSNFYQRIKLLVK